MTCSVHNIVKEALENQRTDKNTPIVDGNTILDKKAFSLFNNDLSRRLKEQYQVESDETIFNITQVETSSQKLDYFATYQKFKETRWSFNNSLIDQLEYNRLNPPTSPLEELGIKPGVAELFESNPELASIGTAEQYSAYLDTIFPDSKVKDIVYHDGGHGKIKEEGFRKDLIGIGDGGVMGNGFYFYFDRSKKYSEYRSHTESVLLNTINPKEKRKITDSPKNVLPFSKKDILKLYKGEFKSIKILSVNENIPYNWSKDKYTGLLQGNLPTKDGRHTMFYIGRNDNSIQKQADEDYANKKISLDDYRKIIETRIGYDFIFKVDFKKVTEEEYINALKEIAIPKEIYIEGVDDKGNKARSTFILRTDGDIQEGRNYLSKNEFTEKEEKEYTYEESLGILSGIIIDTTIIGTHGKYIGNYADALAKINIDGVIGYFGTGKEIVVFEPEQIHILGSKQDIEGFKEFVREEPLTQIDIDNLPEIDPC